MAGLNVHAEWQLRDNSGRFLALLDAAGHKAAEALVEAAADDAAERAPVGPGRKDYGRREKLSSSIMGLMTGAKRGVIGARAGHGASQEHGAGPHPIPNAFGMGLTVIHPGNAPQPYIRPAIIAMKGAKAVAIVKRFYP